MILCRDGGVIRLFGDNLGSEGGVGGQYAMEGNEMKAGTRDEGGQALEEFEGCHDDMGGAVAVGCFEFEHDVAFWCARQAFMAQGGTGDVAAEAFEVGALMGAAVHVGMQAKAQGYARINVGQAGLSDSTILNVLCPLQAIFRDAIEEGKATVNPVAGIKKRLKLRKKSYKQADLPRYTRSELQLLLQTAREKKPHWYPLFLCAARTGMREGELIELRWSDIDFNGRFVEVKRKFYGGRIEPLKNDKKRRVDMSTELIGTLGTLWREHKGDALRSEMAKPARERRKTDDVLVELRESLVFHSDQGDRVDPANFRKRVMYRLADVAGIRTLPVHALRHTFGSLLIEAGVPLKYISEQLGHGSIQITADMYGHLEPGVNREFVDRLDGNGVRDSGNKMETIRMERGADHA